MIKNGDEYKNCIDEQSFKRLYLKMFPLCHQEHKLFCIETEETVKGFPDVMEVIRIGDELHTFFYEFKFSDKRGNIKFQPTQPAFYRSNAFMKVCIIAYNCSTNKIHEFLANDIFDEKSPYKINLKAEINLNKAEKEEKNESTSS